MLTSKFHNGVFTQKYKHLVIKLVLQLLLTSALHYVRAVL